MDEISSLIMNEDGSIKYSKEKPLDPFALEDIRESFDRFDKRLDEQGLHMERVAVSGFTSTAWSGPPPYPVRHMEDLLSSWNHHGTSPATVCISVAMEEGQKLTKEQILIIDHFAKRCSAALCDFYQNGTLPDEKIKRQKEREETRALLGFDVIEVEGTFYIKKEDGTLVPWVARPNSTTPKE